MPIPVTRTKIIPPRRRSELVSRQRLIDLLFELMDYKLVIVAAPAGYGKTSLLIDFAFQSDLAVCWYAIDVLDRDIFRFIAHLIAAVEHRFPEFGKLSLASLEASAQSNIDIDLLVTTIVNEVYEHVREHFILILDDYHLVNDQKEINTFISRLAQELDENCHLILSSRALLAIPDMPLMVARSMVGGLSFEELTFQPEEIQRLFEQNYQVSLSKGNADELAQVTEGWITGLLLSTETMRLGIKDRIRLARVSRVGLYDYLTQQVLDHQPEDIQDFLLKTSLYDEFDLKMCKILLGEEYSWENAFHFVLENNLFVLPVGEEGQFIRYHHLFHDFLQERLTKKYPDERLLLLRKIITYYSSCNDWERAHAASKQLGDQEVLVDVILQAGPVLIRDGRLTLLADWIDDLPAEIFYDNPKLMALRAHPEMVLGQGDRGLGLFNQAIDCFRDKGDEINLAITLANRALALRIMGKYQDSITDAQESLSLINYMPGLLTHKATALRAMGVSRYYVGNFDESIKNLENALELYQQSNDRQNVATTFITLGLFFMNSGRYQEALGYYIKAMDYYNEVSDKVRQSNLLNNLGVLNHLMGNYEEAVNNFENALLLAKKNRYSRMEAYILASIGDLYADLGAYQAALDAYRKSHDLARIIDFSFLILYNNIAAAKIHRSMGNFVDAEHYLMLVDGQINKTNISYEQGLYKLEAGRLSLVKNETSNGIGLIREAAKLLEEAGQIADASRAFLILAQAYYLINDISQAKDNCEHSLSLASGLDSPHVLVVTGIEVKSLLEFMTKKIPVLPIDDLLGRINSFEMKIPAIRKRIRAQSTTLFFVPPKLTIQAFDKSGIEIDGKPITVPEWQNQRKVRELFFYLLTRPSGARKEEIGLIFWPESSTSQLKLQFKNAIYRLRHALGPDIVLFDEERYWFNRDLDYEYDVENFIENIKQGEIAPTMEQKIVYLQAAINQYKGNFCPEMDGIWVEEEREYLRNLYIQAITRLAELNFQLTNYSAALEYCQKALTIDPCMEEMHRLAMRVYAETGNRAAVSRQYEQCKLSLHKEVNALPSPQTTLLYESLIR